MSIKIVFDDGLYRPVVFCDHCDDRITHVAEATYEWLPDGDEPKEVRFLHHRCVMPHQEAAGTWYCSDSLEYFAIRLANNTGQSPRVLIEEIEQLKKWEAV